MFHIQIRRKVCFTPHTFVLHVSDKVTENIHKSTKSTAPSPTQLHFTLTVGNKTFRISYDIAAYM